MACCPREKIISVEHSAHFITQQMYSYVGCCKWWVDLSVVQISVVFSCADVASVIVLTAKCRSLWKRWLERRSRSRWSRVTRLKMSKPRSRWVIICFACCWTLVVCFFESLTRSGQFQVIFYCFRNESLVFLIVPERLVSIQKLSRSKLHKAGPAQDGDWRHTMSANQMHCLDDCSAPDYGAYTGCSKTVLSS